MTPPAAALSAPATAARPAYLCHCLKVTADQVQDAVAFAGCESVAEVTDRCGAGGGCTACHRRIRALLGGR